MNPKLHKVLSSTIVLTVASGVAGTAVQAEDGSNNDQNQEETSSENEASEDEQVFELGDEDEQISELKEDLQTLDYGPFEETDVYDEETEEAVTSFQEDHELEVTGEADEETVTLAEELAEEAVFVQGDEAEEIAELKANLTALEYGDLDDSKLYDEATEEGVYSLQADEDELEATGAAGEATLNLAETLAVEVEAEENEENESNEHEDHENDTENNEDTDESAEDESADETDDADNDVNDDEEAEEIDNEELEEDEEAADEETAEDNGENEVTMFGVQNNDTKKEKDEEEDIDGLQDGDHDDQAIVVKEHLEILGYGSFSGTTYYGPQTTSAVASFQADQEGLEETGVADQKTQDRLKELAESPLRDGMYREDAVEVKELLEELGFGSFSGTTYYGPQTTAAVKAYQEHYGENVTGEVTSTTMADMADRAKSVIRDGDRDDRAVDLKDHLEILGYGSFSGTTYYGPQTTAAVASFQADQEGLEETGVADQKTQDRLQELAQSPLRDGMYREDAVEVKELLEKLGFGSFSGTTYYGPQTTAAVKAYQEHYGENVTGEVTSSTLTEMANRSESILQDGDYDDRAVSLKEHLEVLGYGSFAGTTYYGPQTSAAVARFQASEEGLTETGNADRKTIERLKNMAEGPLNNSMYREDAIEVKNYLEQLGFGSFNGTDYYGPQTASAVKRYQEHYELEVTGSVSKEALAGMQERAESILSNGDRHESAIPVKSHLEILGYGSFSGTTYYGPQTTAAVKAFQESEDGIAATGMANERTQERLKALAEGPLRNGMYREDAVEVKDLLQELGFGLFSGTSYFGPQTEAAVQNFQNHYGYTIDGEVSEETLVHLNEEYVNTLSNGDRADLAVKVKEHLEILGYGSFSGTTYYGPRTTAAIKEFQSDNDLYVNGIANPTTVELLETLAEAEEDVSLGIVTASSALNMRTAPNTSGKVINQLPRDTVVEILSTEDNGWHRIRFDDEEGYVSGNFIEEYIEIEGMNTGQVVVNSRLNIRSEPRSGNSNTIIDSLSSGTDVEIIETIENVGSQTWHQIRYGNGQLGYANAGYIHLDTGEGVAGGPLAGKTVYLDAGHGGPDPGGTANGLLEKEIALDVSLRAEQALREAGANVVMARRSDFYLTPGQRAFQSNNSEADIFVSVHANIFNGEANGTETIWHSGHESSNSERLAHNLQDATVSALNTNYRRVFEHSRTITVVEQNEIPSALLELGFMDHAGDAEKLRSSKYRDKSAEAITNGVLNYFQ